MAAVTCSAPMDFAIPTGVQAGWSEMLAKFYALPGSHLLGNLLAWKITSVMNSGIKSFEAFFRDPRFQFLSLEDRQAFAAYVLDGAEMLEGHLQHIKPFKGKSRIQDFFLNRFEDAVARHSDLAETIALAVDPEITALGKRLDDVL